MSGSCAEWPLAGQMQVNQRAGRKREGHLSSLHKCEGMSCVIIFHMMAERKLTSTFTISWRDDECVMVDDVMVVVRCPEVARNGL